jgi:hypothetical protein
MSILPPGRCLCATLREDAIPVPGVAQTIVVCRLRTVLELGRPRKTMACPTANLLYRYF